MGGTGTTETHDNFLGIEFKQGCCLADRPIFGSRWYLSCLEVCFEFS